MGDLFVYILKSAACLVVFYLFFRLLLNRDTFHRFNRIAVLCILILSLIVPFCNIHVQAQTQVNQAVLELHQLFVEPADIEVVSQPDKTLTWMHGVLLVYLIGIIFFICRNVYFLIRIRYLIQRSKIEKVDDRVKLVVCGNSVSPFSWMNYIIISESDLRENGKEIVTHEMAHVRKHHSMDILLADICIVFQWFNPAAWLIKQELQNIHEYEADEYVLKEGINAKDYQLLLIKKAVGKRLYSMANSFNHSKLKKRITMMSKQKSSPWARLKYFYVLPVTVVAITAFARPEVTGELDKISEVKVSDFAEMAKVSDVTKINSSANDTVTGLVLTNIPVEGYKKKDVSKVSVTSDEVVIVKGSKVNISPDGKAQLALNVSGDVQVKTLRLDDKLDMKSDNVTVSVSEDKLYNLTPVNTSVTKSVSGIVKDSSGNPIAGASVVIVGTKTGTITDMNGKFVLEVPDNATLSISMIDMNSATVKVDKLNFLTVTLASQGSGKSAKIVSDSPADVVVKGYGTQVKRPLIIVDGKKSLEGISNIEPGNIENIKTMEKDEAVKQYGAEAKNGVVLVTTKNKK